MAEITQRRTGEILRKLFEILMAESDGVQASEALKRLAAQVELTAYDDVGLFVCTGGFTKDAESEARTQEKRRVKLISLNSLFDLWVQHYDKLSDQARRRLPLRPIYFLAPEG